MKLIFKKSLLERREDLIESMIDAINEAKNHGKEIEKILVTREEWHLLEYPFAPKDWTLKSNKFAGYPLEVEEKPNEG
jgi:hypothetical protein